MIEWGRTVIYFKVTTQASVNQVAKGVEKIVDSTGTYLKKQAEKVTPIDTGKARRSWAMSTSKNGKDRRIVVFNTAKTPKKQYYLYWVENGTIKIAPRRFFIKQVIKAEKRKEKMLIKLQTRIAKRFNHG